MDGNGRWAERLGRPRTYGHHRGIERVRDIVRAAPALGVEMLTLFAFSTENWRRPNHEISVLMSLFDRYIVREVDEVDEAGIRVRFIGYRHRLAEHLQRLMRMVEERTAANDRLTVQVAIDYGGRAEIVEAARRIAADVADGTLDPDAVDEDAINKRLFTAGDRDPDLVIRTSGEMRVSNFLLWQAAYAEYAFVEECWPDFTAERFEQTLRDCAGRDRRFGAIAAR